MKTYGNIDLYNRLEAHFMLLTDDLERPIIVTQDRTQCKATNIKGIKDLFFIFYLI